MTDTNDTSSTDFDMDALRRATENMDWGQVVGNGGPPCSQIGDDVRFCGRAERREGHPLDHEYVSLFKLIESQAAEIDRLQENSKRVIHKAITGSGSESVSHSVGEMVAGMARDEADDLDRENATLRREVERLRGGIRNHRESSDSRGSVRDHSLWTLLEEQDNVTH